MNLLEYLLKRTGGLIVLLLLVTIVAFALVRLTPGDPAELMLGEYATPEALAALRAEMGLDLPVYQQYVVYLTRILRGDFGNSIRAQRPVLEMIFQRLPSTMELTGAAFLFALLMGIPIGVLSAVRRYSLWDSLARLFAFLGQSMPAYWLGLMLIIVFAVRLRVLPVCGKGSLRHIILPGITLGFYLVGLVIRLTRNGMLEVLCQDYIRTARSKGLAERVVIYKHAFRNSLIPLVTVLAVQVGTLIGGAVVTETVFAWPGIGSLMVQAIYNRDYPIVQAAILISAVVFVVLNLLVDILYSFLDPRIRYPRSKG